MISFFLFFFLFFLFRFTSIYYRFGILILQMIQRRKKKKKKKKEKIVIGTNPYSISKKTLLLIIHSVVPHLVSLIPHTRSNNIDLSQNNAFITLMTTQFSHRISSCSTLFLLHIYIYIYCNKWISPVIYQMSK